MGVGQVAGRNRVLILRSAGLLFTAALVYWLVDWMAVSALFGELSLGLFLGVLFLALLRVWLTSVRWRLLNPDRLGQLKQWDYFRYMMIGGSFNLVMPGALGGDAVRSAFLMRDLSEDRGSNLASLVVDRGVGFFSIVALGTLACLAAPGLKSRSGFLAVLLSLDSAFLLASLCVLSDRFNKRLKDLVDRPGKAWQRLAALVQLWSSMAEHYREHSSRALLALLVSIPVHASWFLIVYWIATDLGIGVSFLGISMITALSWLVTALPLSFGGLGLRELSFISLLSTQGVGPDPSTLLSLLQFGVIVVTALLGVPFIWLGRRRSSSD